MADSEFDNDDVQDSRRVAAAKANLNPRLQTVKDPQRMAFPGIYGNPKEIAAMAASRVAPEDPALKQLFGVTRADLYEMNQGRKGNLPGTLPGAAAKPKGSAAAARVMTKENEQRLVDTLGEAQKHESLRHGMEPWYITDPAFQRMVHLIGYEDAVREYDRMNHLMGMASPASEVMTEIPRGTAAYALNTQGRFADFLKYAGKPEGKRTRRFPADIRNVPGHAYHKTAQAGPMAKYLESGEMTMKTPKVPLYIQASGVPETGFQTATPVGDAHWSRAVGLADTRNWKNVKGKQAIPGASVTNPEMAMLSPWWRSQIADKVGLEPVSAQGLTWGTFAPQTGVDTPIGAGKLELLAKNIMMTARRLNVSPETARDMVLMGKTYAGKAEGGSVGYAEGGMVKDREPSQDEMMAHIMLKGMANLKDVGANEAPNMHVKRYVPPAGGPGLPVGGVDFQQGAEGQQMLPEQEMMPLPQMQPGPQGQPGQPPAPAGQPGQPGQPPAPPQGQPPGAPRSNILQMTPQGQAMAAMRPNMPPPKMAGGGSTTPSVEEMRRAIASAATSAGMKAPVTNTRNMMTLQDSYQSLGDDVRKKAADMQDMIESMPFKYDVGHTVFTAHSAKNNLPPFKVIRKALVGNSPMRENHAQLGPNMGKFIKDPATGKTKRTPYEPGYDVRREHKGEVHEMRIPESAILDKLAAGGTVKDYIRITERKL